MKYHFIGIKGSGMAALAQILKSKGFEVQGSDTESFVFTEKKLAELEIPIYRFKAANFNDVDFVVVGHNFLYCEELDIIRNKQIPYLEYHLFLSILIEKHFSVAVSGTHGKTTTTSLIYHILNNKKNCNTLIGDGTGIYNSDFGDFVFEACEYKDHFLEYCPNIVLINNIDYDHSDYFKSVNDYLESFNKFANNAKEIVIINGDDFNLKKLKINNKKVYKFGINPTNHIYATEIEETHKGIEFQLYFNNRNLAKVSLPFFGKHMIYNSLAAISVGILRKIKIEEVISGLLSFQGVRRRFKETILNDDIFIDDYAHHPTAIKATIEAVRQKYPNRKVIAIFKPDRYSRVNQFAKEFARSLELADRAFILDFPADSNKEELSIDGSLITFHSKKLVFFKDYQIDYLKIKQVDKSVYLFMSSKDLTKIQTDLIKYKKIDN